MPAQTREPALVDDGIPGGPGVYSTRCPPLPRLRLTESREVVRRAALRAKGVDPDLVERCVTPSAKNKHERTADADSAGDSPISETAKPSPRAADPLADLVDGADALFDLPEGRKRDRGGGGGGDFSVGARADHHLRTMHDVRRVRAERRALRTLLPGKCSNTGESVRSSSSNPGVKGTYSNVATYGGNRGADRVLAEERKRIKRELNAARTLVRRRECAHNAAVNARVGRERELRALNGELEVVAREAARANDLSGLDAELDAARTKAREKQALADEEAETSLRRAHIARRLTAHNVELRRGTAALKADLADATADADACREYERGALDARKRAHDALEWVRARYLERVNAWKRDVAHAKVERDELLDTLKEEKTKERILARRLERERARSEADCVGAKRATESAREEVTRRESEEEWCRAALQRLASAAGLHDVAAMTPAQILAQLEKSRDTRAAADAQIVEAQERERAAWATLLAKTEELRAARLGIDDDDDDDGYDDAGSFGGASVAGRSSRARSVAASRARRATLQPFNARHSTFNDQPPFNVGRPSVPRTSAAVAAVAGRTRRSSTKPPVPKMSRMRAASISVAAAFSPSPKLPNREPPRTSEGRKERPPFARVSALDVGSRRDERLERSIASREKELNAKIRDFNRITSSLATMDEGLKAVDDMVTRVTRVPKRAELRGGAAARANGESPGVGGRNGGKAGVKAVGKGGPTSRMSAPTFASDARAKERDRRRRKEQQTSSPALTSLDEEGEEEEEEEEDDDGGDGGEGGEMNRDARDAPRRRASDLWSAVRRSIPEDSEEVSKRDAADADDADTRRRLPRRSDAILARYERLPGRLDALLRRISGVMRALPSGRGRRATVVLGAGRSFANGGRGVGPEHFLAGVGHRVGKVPNTVDEVDDDPARMRLKRGRAYREMAMKWCFRAGRPIAGDDDDDDILVTGDDGLLHFGEGARRESPSAENDEDARRKKTLAAMASVGLGAAAFRRFVRKERSERVPSRADLKTRSDKAAAKVERARLAAERRRWREEEEERKAAEQDDSD